MNHDEHDELIVVGAVVNLLGEIQARIDLSTLSDGDRLRDKTASEAARLGMVALKRLLDGREDGTEVRREVAAITKVVSSAKGPITTAEGFKFELEKARKDRYLW